MGGHITIASLKLLFALIWLVLVMIIEWTEMFVLLPADGIYYTAHWNQLAMNNFINDF